MTTTPSASGADLARQALAAARAAAKTRPTTGPKRPRASRAARSGGRDPQGLGGILARLTAEQGWDASIGGGNLIDQWAHIAPTELATTVQPVAYDPDRGILELRPSSPAYATQVRLFQQQLAKHLNTQLGRPAVRTIRVLAPGGTTAAADTGPEPDQPAPVDTPAKTRDTACEGYRRTLHAHQAAKTDSQPTNPYVVDAITRQNQALTNPHNREPQTAFTDALAETERITGPTVRRSEMSRRAALAYKRGGGDAAPVRRAFDVA